MSNPFYDLPPVQKKIVQMVCEEGLTATETARGLHRTVSTITTQLHRARMKVKARNIYHLIILYWKWREAGDREYDSWNQVFNG